MEVVVGTYEELILGYTIDQNENEYKFETSFTDHSHTGMVKALAVSKRGVLASGSTDEHIKLLNLCTRRELGTLMHHEGSITSVQFFGKKHMFSTSEDGTIGVWRVGKWECLRTLKGHKGPVNYISVHPTGKMALSVGNDKTLITWNLITGKVAYKTSIKSVADSVHWTPKGDRYIIVTNNAANVYNVETAAVEHTLKTPGRINTVVFLTEDVVAMAGEGGTVHIYSLETMTQMAQFSTDTNRVKGMACSCRREDETQIVATASSDGFIKLWILDMSTWSSKLAATHNTKFRLVSLVLNEKPDKSDSETSAPADVKVETEVEKKGEDGDDDEEQEEDREEEEKEDTAKQLLKTDSNDAPKKKKRKKGKKKQDALLENLKAKRKFVEVDMSEAVISKRKLKKMRSEAIVAQKAKKHKKKQLF